MGSWSAIQFTPWQEDSIALVSTAKNGEFVVIVLFDFVCHYQIKILCLC